MEQAELEAKLKANEEALKANEKEMAHSADLAMFGLLTRGWVKAIEGGTVDWDDLIARLETASATAQRMRDA